VDDYIKQLKNPRYAKQGIGQEQMGDREFFTALKKGGYAEDPNYVNTLTSIAEKQRGIKPGTPGEVPTYERPATSYAQNDSSKKSDAAKPESPLDSLIKSINSPMNIADLTGLAASAGAAAKSAAGSISANAQNKGSVIDLASTGISELVRQFDKAMASITNVTNNNTQAASAPQSKGKLPSVYDDTFVNLFQRVV